MYKVLQSLGRASRARATVPMRVPGVSIGLTTATTLGRQRLEKGTDGSSEKFSQFCHFLIKQN